MEDQLWSNSPVLEPGLYLIESGGTCATSYGQQGLDHQLGECTTTLREHPAACGEVPCGEELKPFTNN
jgi:hypothetical protein